MPIRPEFRKFYGREWRTVTRPRVLERDGHACKQCRAPNHATIARIDRYPGWWFTMGGEAHDTDGALRFHFRGSEFDAPDRLVRIVLTVAHLNHTPGDDRDENLAALCQWCHLHHDLSLHIASARQTRVDRKDAARPLLRAIQEEAC